MKRIAVNILQFLFFLSIGSVILFFVYRSQNEAYKDECCIQQIPQWEMVKEEAERQALLQACREAGTPETACDTLLQKLLNDFGRLRYGWLLLVMLAFVISNVNRTYKWIMLLKPMGYRPRFVNAFLSIWVGYFANLGLPRMGEVVRAGVLSKYEKIPAEKVMGTIVVDRIVDVILLAITMGMALLFESDKILGFISDNQPAGPAEAEGINWKLIGLAVLLSAGVVIYLMRHRLKQSRFYIKITDILKGFLEGLQTIRKLDKPGLFIFHSVSIWVLFFVMNWLGFQAFPPTDHLGFDAALTVFVFGTLGFVIPSPGGMGTFHFLVIAALTLFYGIKGDDAFSIANIIFFTIQIGFNSLMGIVSLTLLPVVNNKEATERIHAPRTEE